MDGTILINQASAMAGQITPGDTPGFPVTISRPGSYRLSGNLAIPQGVSGIVVAASNVTIDLNGFQISGIAGSDCGITDNGNSLTGITIRNGTVTLFAAGVMLQHSQAVVEGIQVFATAATGMQTGPYSTVKGNTISNHGMVGVNIGMGSIVIGNVISHCAGMAGSVGAGSIVSDNIVNNNFSPLSVGANSIVKDNAVMGNGTGV